MIYKLEFKKSALKEWKKLNPTVRQQFKNRLKERLEKPRILSSALSGEKDLYKIKLRQLGYRLVYQVTGKTVTVTVVAVGKRNKNKVYNVALSRIRRNT